MQKISCVFSFVWFALMPYVSEASCDIPIECYQQALEALKQATLLVEAQQAENETIIKALQTENERIIEQNQGLTAESLKNLAQAHQLVKAQQAENKRLAQENKRFKTENRQLKKKLIEIKVVALKNKQELSEQQSAIDSLEQTMSSFK